jgi:ElaB/YqjD/DUF883 family membrane-anchored ribosome-binding protein
MVDVNTGSELQQHDSRTGGREAGGAMERAQELTQEARHQASELAGDVKSQTQHVLERTKEEVSKEASSRTEQFAGTMHDMADELRTMADADADGRLHGMVSSAADRADRWASQLDQRGFDGVVDDLKATVRRNPGIVLAVAAASGFIVGRLLRDANQVQSNGHDREPRLRSQPPTREEQLRTGSTEHTLAGPSV